MNIFFVINSPFAYLLKNDYYWGQITNNSKFSLNPYNKKERKFLVYLFSIVKSPTRI